MVRSSTERVAVVVLLATGLGCRESEPRCDTDLVGPCQSFAELVEAVPEGVEPSDWVAAATAAHERTHALLGKYYTGEIGVWRGSVSAVDSNAGFVDEAALASLGHVEVAQYSHRKEVCELALFSSTEQMWIAVEQPTQEPGISHFSKVRSFEKKGGLSLSCVDCLPNLCEQSNTGTVRFEDIEVVHTLSDNREISLNLSAELTPIDPWTLTIDDLRALSTMRTSSSMNPVDHLETCGDGLQAQVGSMLWEESPDSGWDTCVRIVEYTYKMYVDPSCDEVYGIRDLQLGPPERCCWQHCTDCGQSCEPTD